MPTYLMHPKLWTDFATNVSGFMNLNGKTYMDYVLQNLSLSTVQELEIAGIDTYEELVKFLDKHGIDITHDADN